MVYRIRRLACLAILTLGAVGLTSVPGSADASLVYAVQVGANSPAMDDGDRWPELGASFQLRGGYALPIPFFDLEIEMLVGGQLFRGDTSRDRLPMLWDARVGARGGASWILYPQGFMHVGYGRAFGYPHGAPQGVIADIGAAFDLTAIPYLRIGIFGAYNHMFFADTVETSGGDRDLQWFSFGIQGAFVDD
ncbi:MAG: hypothetical protein RIT45_2089 [Pseudomonadota bacterium]|jgi:hypothetical protein